MKVLCFIVFLWVSCLLLCCSPVDKLVRSEAKNGLKGKPLFLASKRDSIAEYLYFYENDFFVYSCGRLRQDVGISEARVIKETDHGYAGNYKLVNDTVFLSFYKNYKPSYIGNFMVYTSDKSQLIYDYGGESNKQRRLQVRVIGKPKFQLIRRS